MTEFQQSDTPGYDWIMRDRRGLWNDFRNNDMIKRCPLGSVGDKLWVREAWKSSEYECTEEPQDEGHVCSEHCRQTYVYYKATPRVGYRPIPDKKRIRYLDETSPLHPKDWYEKGWRSPIHMPRWASRIDLEVLAVRVQRLQDISEDDAKAEGVDGHAGGHGPVSRAELQAEPGYWHPRFYRDGFEWAWSKLHDKPSQFGASWARNPWVWAIEFKRLDSHTTHKET